MLLRNNIRYLRWSRSEVMDEEGSSCNGEEN